jgi:release factor glutamine methyltransferase
MTVTSPAQPIESVPRPDEGARASRHCTIDGLEVSWDERVLRPRAWTRAQSRWAVELHPNLPPGPILELCCGVGHIGLLTARDTGRDAVLVDASAAACEHARRAAVTAGLGDAVSVLRHHVDGEPLPGCAPRSHPVVLIDPPYLTTEQMDEAGGNDPRHAVDGGRDGLRWIEPMLGTASHHVVDGGVCLLQVRGPHQAEQIVSARRDQLAELGLRPRALRRVDDRRAVLLLRADGAERDVITAGTAG